MGIIGLNLEALLEALLNRAGQEMRREPEPAGPPRSLVAVKTVLIPEEEPSTDRSKDEER
jgi:hypothetical protein